MGRRRLVAGGKLFRCGGKAGTRGGTSDRRRVLRRSVPARVEPRTVEGRLVASVEAIATSSTKSSCAEACSRRFGNSSRVTTSGSCAAVSLLPAIKHRRTKATYGDIGLVLKPRLKRDRARDGSHRPGHVRSLRQRQHGLHLADGHRLLQTLGEELVAARQAGDGEQEVVVLPTQAERINDHVVLQQRPATLVGFGQRIGVLTVGYAQYAFLRGGELGRVLLQLIVGELKGIEQRCIPVFAHPVDFMAEVLDDISQALPDLRRPAECNQACRHQWTFAGWPSGLTDVRLVLISNETVDKSFEDLLHHLEL